MKYVVIGAGVVGTAIARELAIRKKGEILVIEKEQSAGMHTSGRNSGVIHSGINQKPGTLKAKLCVEGNKLLREYCRQHQVPMEECGTVVVANSPSEQQKLRELERYALTCNVPYARIISREELKEREPYARGLEGLFSPTGAIVDSKALVRSLVKDAQSKGVEFQWISKVEKIGHSEIETAEKTQKFDFLINCGGLHADTLAHSAGFGKEYSIIPFRGDYREIDAKVNGMIYHVPDLRFPFLGVHLTKTIDEKVIAGPTATLSFSGREGYQEGLSRSFFSETANSPGFWRWVLKAITGPQIMGQIVHNLRISRSEKAFLEDVYQIYDGEVQLKSLSNYKSGIRPQVVNRAGRLIDDFLLERSENQLHLLNTVSPGLTASLAFAKHLIDTYIE